MISVSNQPPASERLRLVGLLLLGLCLMGPRAPAAAVGPEITDIVFAPGTKPGIRQEEWLREDRAWLQEQEPARRTLPAAQGAAAGKDTLDLVARWVLAQVGEDSLAVARPLSSRLRDRWLERGFLQVAVRPELLQTGARLVLRPGPRFTLARLEVKGGDFPGRAHLLSVWLPQDGDVFSPARLADGIEQVLTGAGEAGYPFVRWVTSDIVLDPESATVRIKANLLLGSPAVIGPITSDLPPGRPSAFLARASGLRTGTPFRESEVRRSVQRLLSRDLYASVGTPRVYPTSSVDTVGIHFPVIPRQKVNRLQVVLGLSRKQDTGPSRLSGEVDLHLPDMAGSGRNLGLNWRDDGDRKSHFGLDYLEPMAFGTPLDMWVAVDSEIQTDSYTRFRLDNRWQMPVVALWGVELGVGWDRSTYPTGDLVETSRVRARGAFLHRRGDRTVSGWSATFAIENAWRTSTMRPAEDDAFMADNQLGEALVQRIYETDTSGEIWLGDNWGLAGRVSFRQLSGSGEVVPLSEQFRFGGAASLRGYREDEFHGSRAAWGGVELRIGPPGGSRLYTFYDLGYFGFSSLESDLAGNEVMTWKNGWPKGYGLGLLVKTPGGDISLAVGFPGTVDFNLAKLHVTLLESF